MLELDADMVVDLRYGGGVYAQTRQAIQSQYDCGVFFTIPTYNAVLFKRQPLEFCKSWMADYCTHYYIGQMVGAFWHWYLFKQFYDSDEDVDKQGKRKHEVLISSKYATQIRTIQQFLVKYTQLALSRLYSFTSTIEKPAVTAEDVIQFVNAVNQINEDEGVYEQAEFKDRYKNGHIGLKNDH